MKILFTFLIGLPALCSVGQSIDAGLGYYSPGTGLWTKEFPSPAALLLNPAAAADKPSFEGLILSRKPFLIDGLQAVNAYARQVFENSTAVGLSVQHTSFNGFRETRGSLALGKKLSGQWRVGIGFSVNRRRITGTGAISSIAGSLAVQRQFRSCTMGLLIIPRQLPGKGGKTTNVRPSLALGIGKDWSNQLYMDYTLYWQTDNGLQMCTSICYQPVTAWRLAIRVLSQPLRYGFETGYQRKQYAVRIFNDWHPQLGWSPGVLLAFCTPQKRGI